MSYGYAIYHGKEFCSLGVGYDSQGEVVERLRELFDSPAGKGYYTHAEIRENGKVLQTVNNGDTLVSSTTESDPPCNSSNT